MANLRIVLGWVPSTEKIEADRAKLGAEYQRILSAQDSVQLKRYQELDSFVNSEEFKKEKKAIESQKFKDTPEFKKEQEYNQQRKNKDIKSYYKVKKSKALEDFNRMEDSKELMRYYELEAYLQSDEFKKEKQYMLLSPKKKFEQSDQFKALQDYQRLKKDPAIKNYYKFINNKAFDDYQKISGSPELEALNKGEDDKAFVKSKAFKNYRKLSQSPYLRDFEKIEGSDKLDAYQELEKYVTSDAFKKERKDIEGQKYNQTEAFRKEQEFNNLNKSKPFREYFAFRESKPYKNYLKLDGSETIQNYESLERYVFSPEFNQVKEYMNQSGKQKFNQSDLKKKLDEYHQLKENSELKFYFKNKDHKRYDDFRNWKLSFAEDFDNSLDMNRWTPRYYWGDKLMKDCYSLSGDYHLISENNVETNQGKLRIYTRQEKVKGKSWEPIHGFLEKDFDFTSGTVNTGHSFRQKFGRFEAKIKFNKNFPVSHSFWMVGDKSVPHIDVVRADNMLTFNQFWKNGSPTIHKSVNKIKTTRYNGDFYIYSVEWTENALEWKLNGITVAKQTQGVPQEPMYLAISSGIYKEGLNLAHPAVMEVDWVRVYEPA